MAEYNEYVRPVTTLHPSQHVQAVAKYRRLAAAGNPRAIGQLGYCTIIGLGEVRPDQPEGLALLEQAAELKDTFSLYALGSFYMSGLPPLGQDVKRGVAYLRKISENTQSSEARHYYNYMIRRFGKDCQTQPKVAPKKEETLVL